MCFPAHLKCIRRQWDGFLIFHYVTLIISSILVTFTMLLQDEKGGDPQQRMTKMVMAFVFGAITSSLQQALRSIFSWDKHLGLLRHA